MDKDVKADRGMMNDEYWSTFSSDFGDYELGGAIGALPSSRSVTSACLTLQVSALRRRCIRRCTCHLRLKPKFPLNRRRLHPICSLGLVSQ